MMKENEVRRMETKWDKRWNETKRITIDRNNSIGEIKLFFRHGN